MRSYRRRKVDSTRLFFSWTGLCFLDHCSWTIAPFLSLGEDQVIKINANSATGDGAVVAFHLHHCPHPAQQRDVCQRTVQITGHSNNTVCITSSPQALVNNKQCFALHRSLLDKHLLKLLTVDELQLFVQFGRRFRNEFYALKAKMFAPLSLSGGKRSRTPILFMTATATTATLSQTTMGQETEPTTFVQGTGSSRGGMKNIDGMLWLQGVIASLSSGFVSFSQRPCQTPTNNRDVVRAQLLDFPSFWCLNLKFI